MKTFDTNDPRLTAYALGELHGDEAAEIEAAIGADASLAAEVEQVRQVAAMLRNGFAREDAPQLTAQQRMAIHHHQHQQQPQATARKLAFRGRAIWLSAGLAAAACLTLAIIVTFVPQRVNVAHRNRAPDQPAAVTSPSATEPTQGFAHPGGGEERQTDQMLLKDAVKEKEGNAKSPSGLTRSLEGSSRQRALSDRPQVAAKPERGTAPLPLPSPAIQQSNGGGSVAHIAPREQTIDAGGRSLGTASSRLVTEGSMPETSTPAVGSATLGPPPPGNSGFDARSAFASSQPGTTGENYPLIIENPFLNPREAPLSTFSVDVDTASYSNVRRYVSNGQLPPKDAVRIEELINYFPYRYEPPSGETPFSANIEVNQAPWNPQHRLLRIGLKGKEVRADMRPATSLVFLIDVSGSMRSQNKLPLVKQSMKLLVDHLTADDRLAIVTYAGNAGLVMDSTYCTHEKKPEISRVIDSLAAGGSTNGAGGIQVAYDVATQHFIKGGVNRVILCTDGDFNVGPSSEADLIRLIEQQRATGVYLTVLGFGSGNLQDAKMKMLSKLGNGNYAVIDTLDEGKKVLVDQLSSTLVPIARDVKVQVEFNPALVGAYRLIGYEQRIMAAQDFNDDRKDAGEIGAGHAVTALYEIIPPGDAAQAATAPAVDDLKFQRPVENAMEMAPSDDLAVVKVRYKPIAPDAGEESIRLEFDVKDSGAQLHDASSDFRFAAAVAAFGMILRDSPYKGSVTLETVLDLSTTDDALHTTSRGDFRNLVEQTMRIMGAQRTGEP